MMLYKHRDSMKSILCLNGDLPELEFFQCKKTIVATDGAANSLQKIGIKPDVIIGDLDSIERTNHYDSKIIYLPDQSQSDFQKAMTYLRQNNLLPTIICGVNGGFIDHILNNINIILENNCIFYVPPILGQVLKSPSTLNLNLAINTKISLLGIPSAKIKTLGLKWEINEERLEFPGHNSCFNRNILNEVSIEVLTGSLLVLVYLSDMEDMGAL
jgi:thiamine pyrophosphokinase